MITEKEARELVAKLKDLQEKSKTDSSLTKELKKHERECFEKLKYLVLMKMGRYKNFSNYEDLVQEGYEALLNGIKTFNPDIKSSFFWWEHKYIDTRISRSANLHTAIRYPLKVAKEQTPHKEMLMPNLIELTNCPDVQLENAQLHHMLDGAIQYLSEKQKNIITMLFGLDDSKPCSVNKVAKNTNLSRSAVLKEYKSAINILREHSKQ